MVFLPVDNYKSIMLYVLKMITPTVFPERYKIFRAKY